MPRLAYMLCYDSWPYSQKLGLLHYGLELDDCQKLLKELIRNPKILRVTIVVDALDQCHDDGDLILRKLGCLWKSRPEAVRLLLSSQEQVRHTALLQNEGEGPIYVKSSLTKDDIEKFIKTEIKKNLELQSAYRGHDRGILLQSPRLRKRVEEELIRRARGM